MPEGERRSARAAAPGIVVTLGDERGRPLRIAGLAHWLARAAPRRARGHVSIALISDARARALNRTYRGKDYATDVLSFPAEAHDSSRRRQSTNRKSGIPHREPFLGEIVIAKGVARRQGRAAGHGRSTELRVLALHGLLHLLGYDHERDNGEMRTIERRLRRKGGLREGLIGRSRP
jgi:probable rRNA maturation factor